MLSDTRGNTFGIKFFQIALTLFGKTLCCLFVYPVTFFYACFDRKARKAAMPYLRSRFPHAKNYFFHFWKMITAQGHAMILAQWIRTGHSVPITMRNEQYRQEMRDNKDGMIMLMSHVGCWQAAIPIMMDFPQQASLLIQNNANAYIASNFQGRNLNVISNDGPFGGLLECISALENKHLLCIMGDRQDVNTQNALHITLRERDLTIPEAPWLLSARCKCKIYPVFTIMHGLARSYEIIFVPPIEVLYDGHRKPNPNDFTPYLKQYATALDSIMQETPYQIFHFS